MQNILKREVWYIAAMIFLTVTFGWGAIAHAVRTTPSIPTETPETYDQHTLFSATTTSATSTNLTGGGGMVPLAGATKVTWSFGRGGATGPNTGVSRFRIQVTLDGSTWHDFNTLYQNDVSLTATTSVSISAATSTVLAYMDVTYGAFLAARCIVLESTDGDHTCKAAVEY